MTSLWFIMVSIILKKKTKQRGNNRNGSGIVKCAIVKVVPGTASERYSRTAAEPPQQTANETEHVSKRQHAQQPVIQSQGELL